VQPSPGVHIASVMKRWSGYVKKIVLELSFRRVNTFKGTVAQALSKIQNSRKIRFSTIQFGLAFYTVPLTTKFSKSFQRSFVIGSIIAFSFEGIQNSTDRNYMEFCGISRC
jgi:hypothetical protein